MRPISESPRYYAQFTVQLPDETQGSTDVTICRPFSHLNLTDTVPPRVRGLATMRKTVSITVSTVER